MRKLLSYITQPGNALALLFLLALACSGLFFWQEGGRIITIVGAVLVTVFLIGSYIRSAKKKP